MLGKVLVRRSSSRRHPSRRRAGACPLELRLHRRRRPHDVVASQAGVTLCIGRSHAVVAAALRQGCPSPRGSDARAHDGKGRKLPFGRKEIKTRESHPLGFSPALLRGGDGRLGRSLDPILLYYQSYHSWTIVSVTAVAFTARSVHSRAADPDTLHFQGSPRLEQGLCRTKGVV